MKRFLPLLTLLFTPPATIAAAERVDYVRDVKPVLQARCFACHGPLKQQGKLRLDAATLIRQGGRHGAAVLPGSAAGSLLVERITAGEGERMPPEGKPLTPQEIALLRAWIDQGAPAPADEKPEEDARHHWAFRKPVRPSVPAAPGGTGCRNVVDAFLAAEQARHGLTPSPPADRAILLRRVHLDLIGLPPTRDELHAFLADPTPDAYEKVVERLLDSPRYGERWARHWMDVWRYSDWYGRRAVPDVMNSYPQIWRWRDWIVRSLNADCGYDRMVEAMLAGDEIAPGDEDSLAATGFLVRNWFKWNYNQWMRDDVEHTGKAFLGMTFNCCHCHDHKYDPITQQEYFQFRAFFEPLELRHDRVAGEPDPGPFQKYVYGVAYGPITSGRIRVFDEKLDAPTYFYTGGDERNRVPKRPPVPPGVPAALGGDRLKIEPIQLSPEAWYPGLKPFVQQEETAKRQAAIRAEEAACVSARAAQADAVRLLAEACELTAAVSNLPPAAADVLARRTAVVEDAGRGAQLAEARLTLARADLAWVRARIAADKIVHRGAPGDAGQACRTASRIERQYRLEAAVLAQMQAENSLAGARRNAALPPAQRQTLEKQLSDAAAKVAACRKDMAMESATYTPLTPVYPHTSTGRRAALARWIASPDNPLTARVAVNHLWGWHFGRPLVETTANLGRSGQRPSHPELLDWLAVELMANGWRMKPLHRLLVTSAAYRMRSHLGGSSAANHQIDPDNRLLWRFPVARMEAEVVRDSLLHAGGELDLTMGGPEIPHAQGLTSRRRSLYFAYHGESQMEFLALFDAANPCDAYRRTTSVLPQQALALSNSELAVREGRVLARELWQSVAADTARETAFVRAAFEQILGRAPTPAELRASTGFLASQVQMFVENRAELPGADPRIRACENLVHALFNHNDFVTIR
jgi:mono/diheme cytochrome c family protein